MSRSNYFSDTQLLPFDALDIFNAVLDIEKYPDFLPWCKNITIISQTADAMLARTEISFKAVEICYISEIIFQPPIAEKTGFIKVFAQDESFKNLYNNWKFTAKGQRLTLVEFEIDFQLKSFFMQSILSLMYNKAQKKVLTSFNKRIETLLMK